MFSCSCLYNSKKVQALLNKAWKEYSAQLIKEHGEIPKNYKRDFKIGAKKGFMETCETRKKNMIALIKKINNNNKTKKQKNKKTKKQ